MSSKVLSGGGSSDAFEWRRVAEGAPPAYRRRGRQDAAEQAAAQQAEAARKEREAYERGRREGEGAAREKAAAEVAAARESWLLAVEKLAVYRPEMRREAERDVVQLALAVARRVLHRELTADPEALLGIVKAALESLEGHELQRARVHPSNVALLQQHLGCAGMAEKVTIVADPGLDAGGLVLETLQGNFDASVQTQLQEIDRGLADLTCRKP
jgi:flagellar assembly protein FliH